MSKNEGGKKSSSGLRILWIPGRKRQHPKGVYQATRAPTATYSRVPQRPNEPWALGGIAGQALLIKDHQDQAEMVCVTGNPADVPAGTAEALLATANAPNEPAAAAADVEAHHESPATPADSVTDGGSALSSYGDDDSAGHNTATLLISDKKTNGKKLSTNTAFGSPGKKSPSANISTYQTKSHSSSGDDDCSPSAIRPNHPCYPQSPSLSPIVANTPNACESVPYFTENDQLLEGHFTQNEHSNQHHRQRQPEHQPHLPSSLDVLLALPAVPWNRLRPAGNGQSNVTVDDGFASSSPSSNSSSVSLAKKSPLASASSDQHFDADAIITFAHLQNKNANLDSIDRLDDDCVDAMKLTDKLDLPSIPWPELQKKQKDADAEESENTVTCLYYALQCCECTIS